MNWIPAYYRNSTAIDTCNEDTPHFPAFRCPYVQEDAMGQMELHVDSRALIEMALYTAILDEQRLLFALTAGFYGTPVTDEEIKHLIARIDAYEKLVVVVKAATAIHVTLP